MAHHFLVDAIDESAERTVVTGAEARHAVTVSRVRPGERLTIGDGRGTIAVAEVVAAASDALELAIESTKREPYPAPRLLLAQALAKGGRDELAVQAATELGVDVVIPWQASRSVSRWEGAKTAKGQERWTTIVREASKQSIRAWVPDVDALHRTAELAVRGERMLVLDPTATLKLTEVALDGRDLLLVVGPEGGIAPEEVARLVEQGATPVRLGATVLRTSTAGPAALAVLNARLGRW